MKIGTILKGAYIAGVISGVVGLAVASKTANVASTQVQKLWAVVQAKRKKGPPHE